MRNGRKAARPANTFRTVQRDVRAHRGGFTRAVHRPGMEARARRRRLERWAAGLSLAAGAAHAGVAPGHFTEWWGYGLFFVFASAAQVVLGLALATEAVNARDSGPGWRGMQRALYAAGAVGNTAIAALYVVTRTTGIPWFGPQAGAVEEADALGIATTLAEVATVALLAHLWRTGPEPADEAA
jgi:hypothetical protein